MHDFQVGNKKFVGCFLRLKVLIIISNLWNMHLNWYIVSSKTFVPISEII